MGHWHTVLGMGWIALVLFYFTWLFRFVDGERDAVPRFLLFLLLSLRSRRPHVEVDVPADGPEMSGDELTHVEVVLVVTEGIFNGLGDLQPTNIEDESENEEEGEEDVGFIRLGLASDEREEEITPESEPHNLSVQRGQDHTVESVHRLQLILEPDIFNK